MEWKGEKQNYRRGGKPRNKGIGGMFFFFQKRENPEKNLKVSILFTTNTTSQAERLYIQL